MHNEYFYHNEPHNDAPSVSVYSLGEGRRTGQGATFGPEGGDLGGGPARAQGSPAGGQGGTEAFRGMQAGSAGGLQHTPRALRIWADRGTCTAQDACAGGPRGVGHPTTGYCTAGQASVVDMARAGFGDSLNVAYVRCCEAGVL